MTSDRLSVLIARAEAIEQTATEGRWETHIGPGGDYATVSSPHPTLPRAFVIHADEYGNGITPTEDVALITLLRNCAPELFAVAATALEYVRADENGEPWPAPAVSLRKRLDALTSALARELGEEKRNES